MNNKLIGSTIALTLGSTLSFNASAALASNAILQFADGFVAGSCSLCDQPGRFGSYFTMDLNGNGSISIFVESFAMTRFQGVQINTTQPASGSHNGSPNGSESPSIDMPFQFFGNTGMHQTTSPVTILSDDGVGHVALDFSGWNVTWKGIPDIDLGGDATLGDTGIATLTCGSDCSNGDTFTLNYTAHVPINNPSGFGGVNYGLHLEGVISSVPVPTTTWLFVSGLLGFLGFAHKHKTNL